MAKVNNRRSNLLYYLILSIGHLCFHSIYRIHIRGRENIPPEGPGILVPKHQFWTDIPLVGLAVRRPVSYIAKKELFVYPGIRHFLSSLGGIPLDRGNPVRTLDSFRRMEKLLQEKEFFVLFPEGTYYPYTMGRGKHRFVELILRFQEKMGWQGDRAIPFIPIGIRYLEKKFRREVRVEIGPPVFFLGDSTGEQFTREILGKIAELSGISK
jgi:1-acyl-sn-glycerol-3-phosphate acyltransferase